MAKRRTTTNNDWIAERDGGNIDGIAQDALRREWFLGKDAFRDRLLDLVDQAKGIQPTERPTTKGAEKDHGEREAERLVREYGPKLNLAISAAELSKLRKGDERKAVLAALIRSRKLQKLVNELGKL